jgi:hypothetical protein
VQVTTGKGKGKKKKKKKEKEKRRKKGEQRSYKTPNIKLTVDKIVPIRVCTHILNYCYYLQGEKTTKVNKITTIHSFTKTAFVLRMVISLNFLARLAD